MIKTFLILLSFLIAHNINAQQNITVHFLYGSKPAKGFKHEEKKWFGGKKGGHVTIEAGDSIIGFQPGGNCHVFGKKKNANGYFNAKQKEIFIKDTVALKYTSIIIPLNEDGYSKIKNTLNNYLKKSPYDYAFLGMRCAAATYDILEETGVVKKRTRMGKWVSFFYPQLLRRRILKAAAENNYAVVKTKGRASRVWEKE
ncbi:hypothetical protein [Ferruginibacter sp.]